MAEIDNIELGPPRVDSANDIPLDANRESDAQYLIKNVIRAGQHLCIEEDKIGWPVSGVFDPNSPYWRNLVRLHVMDAPATVEFHFCANKKKNLPERYETLGVPHVRLGMYYGGTQTALGDGVHKVASFAIDCDITDDEHNGKELNDGQRYKRFCDMMDRAAEAIPEAIWVQRADGRFHGHANFSAPLDAFSASRWVRHKLPFSLKHVEVFPKTAQNKEKEGYQVGNYTRLFFNADCPYELVDRKGMVEIDAAMVAAEIEKIKSLPEGPFTTRAFGDWKDVPLDSLETEFLQESYRGYSRHERLAKYEGYMASIEDAISGDGGKKRTFRAVAVRLRFGVPIVDARSVIDAYNQRCKPPWDE